MDLGKLNNNNILLFQYLHTFRVIIICLFYFRISLYGKRGYHPTIDTIIFREGNLFLN